jgi:flagellar M-ring protein FliF
MINLVFIVVAVIGSLFVLKSLMKRLKSEKIVIGTIGGGSYSMPAEQQFSLSAPESKKSIPQIPSRKRKPMLPMGDIEDEISEEAMLKKNQQERIVNYVTKNPMDAAKLINAWMHEDEI